MDKSEIIILVAALVFAAIRLYQKYGRKMAGTRGDQTSSGSDLSVSGEDEYEPYSGK